MQKKFEAKYQKLAEELKSKPWMQVIPHQSELKKEWEVDRWVAGAFATYAVERMNGKSEAEAMKVAKKMNSRANFDNLNSPEEIKSIPDTSESRAHFENLAKGK